VANFIHSSLEKQVNAADQALLALVPNDVPEEKFLETVTKKTCESIKKGHKTLEDAISSAKAFFDCTGRTSTIFDACQGSLHKATAVTLMWAILCLCQSIVTKPENVERARKSLKSIIVDHFSTPELLPYVDDKYLKKAQAALGDGSVAKDSCSAPSPAVDGATAADDTSHHPGAGGSEAVEGVVIEAGRGRGRGRARGGRLGRGDSAAAKAKSRGRGRGMK
jgi:hypothetical protein